jgi:hypothetical protein
MEISQGLVRDWLKVASINSGPDISDTSGLMKRRLT